jgi:hypothetical protein
MTLFDVSAAKAIARAARFATSFESTPGPAGIEKTRREPALLIDRQQRIVQRFEELVIQSRRAAYRAAVEARLSGCPGDSAVMAACVNSATEGSFITAKAIAKAGLASIYNGSARYYDNYRKPGGSNAVRGIGR